MENMHLQRGPQAKNNNNKKSCLLRKEKSCFLLLSLVKSLVSGLSYYNSNSACKYLISILLYIEKWKSWICFTVLDFPIVAITDFHLYKKVLMPAGRPYDGRGDWLTLPLNGNFLKIIREVLRIEKNSILADGAVISPRIRKPPPLKVAVFFKSSIRKKWCGKLHLLFKTNSFTSILREHFYRELWI